MKRGVDRSATTGEGGGEDTKTYVMIVSQPNSWPPLMPALPKHPEGSDELPITTVGVIRPTSTRLPMMLPMIWKAMYMKPLPIDMWPVIIVASVTYTPDPPSEKLAVAYKDHSLVGIKLILMGAPNKPDPGIASTAPPVSQKQ